MCSSLCVVRPIASTQYTFCDCSTTQWPCSFSTSPSTCSCLTSGPLAASSTGRLSQIYGCCIDIGDNKLGSKLPSCNFF